jgi:hypothetical protein
MSEEPSEVVGGPPTLVLEDVKSVEKFFSLANGMVVALVDTEAPLPKCAGIGVIKEYSPKGVWSGFLVPHSFFVIMPLQVMNSKYRNHVAYYKSPSVQTLGCTAGHRILWSGYKVRPIHADCTSPQSSQDSTESRSPELDIRRVVEDIATAEEVGGPPS